MKHPKKLSEFAATAICGNDITSSCLYVSALTITYAGQYAWISLLMVALVLYMFRKIYGEVVGALPLNGGAYNVLLNTTSKTSASVAACLTILSYMATAVISASEAMHYLHGLIPSLPVMIATGVLLTFFLILVILGISESSKVAMLIFFIHISAMVLLIGSAGWYVAVNGFTVANLNFHVPVNGGIWTALFLGFSTAMLGISGFESSANFVEEQEKGVFPKTLRNMWVAVTVINPLMALGIIMVLPLGDVAAHQEALLSHLGNNTGGKWLATLISVDAVLVLSGAVLTSYVGVGGLIRRMTLDRVLPQFLLRGTKSGSTPRIYLVFFLLCISVLVITKGELGPLAGVYTISFLLVMAYFGYGNFLLKIKRARLPRPEYALPFVVAVAVLAVLLALYGNIKLHPEFLVVFLQYFVPAMGFIYLALNRNTLLQYVLVVLKSFFESVRKVTLFSHLKIAKVIQRLTNQPYVYFTKTDDISVLNKVMIYVGENEITNNLKIITVLKEGQTIPDKFKVDLEVLDRAYPDIDIEFIEMTGEFGPELIQQLSKKWNIPTNFMFIGSPGNRFPHRVEDLGGVRLII